MEKEDILKRLDVTSDNPERLEAIRESGMSVQETAKAIGVTLQTLRAWATNANAPRPSAIANIDRLRFYYRTLIDQKGLEPEQATAVLRSIPSIHEDPANLLEQRPPLDFLPNRHEVVSRYVGELTVQQTAPPQE
jgi:transcriptional regulator with XRE-family HTH domain